MRKYIKAKRRHEKVKEDLAILNDDKEFRYPKGMKPFSSPPDQEELDRAWSKTVGQEFTLEIIFERDCSKRDALQVIHHTLAKTSKEIDEEAIRERMNATRTAAQKEKLKERCMKVLNDAWSDEGAKLLGLEAPLRKRINNKVMDDSIEERYINMVEKIKKELKMEEQKKEEQEKLEQKKKEELLTKQPEILLKKVVEDIAEKKMAEMNGMEVDDTNNEKGKMLVNVLKNGKSPGQDPGHNQKGTKGKKGTQAAISTKGKGQVQDINEQWKVKGHQYKGGKGKGKTIKGQRSSKGKGKGKGKSNQTRTGKGPGNWGQKGPIGQKGNYKEGKNGGKGKGKGKRNKGNTQAWKGSSWLS